MLRKKYQMEVHFCPSFFAYQEPEAPPPPNFPPPPRKEGRELDELDRDRLLDDAELDRDRLLEDDEPERELERLELRLRNENDGRLLGPPELLRNGRLE